MFEAFKDTVLYYTSGMCILSLLLQLKDAIIVVDIFLVVLVCLKSDCFEIQIQSAVYKHKKSTNLLGQLQISEDMVNYYY